MSSTSPRRPRLVVGNWKMNPATVDAAVDLARAAERETRDRVRIGVAPPTVFLSAVATALRDSAVAVYAQDVHWEEKGAYTGQVSARMLEGLVAGAIVGHSEVRRDLGDDDARVARKAAAALRSGLRVIYCLGESLDERRAGRTEAVLSRQVREGIATVPRDLLRPERVALAYEPIWAIGTGVAAAGSQAAEAIALLRAELTAHGSAGDSLTILYGGSVSALNVDEFARAEGVDGALVGGASLKADEFAAIVAAFG